MKKVPKPTPEIEKINKMSQLEMASLWRFAPLGHSYFDKSKPFFKIFEERFKRLGGFTSKISRACGSKGKSYEKSNN